jgi:UDP-N-acetylmuramate dehydrogenase
MILLQNIPLSKHSNYKIGGPADYFFEFKTVDELKEAIIEYKKIDENLKNVFVIGKGTNVLFSDEGFRGLVMKNLIHSVKREGNILELGSGVLMEEAVRFATSNNLSGFEWAGGLPGSVGGAIRGNAGAFGGETKDNCIEVESLDLNTLKITKRNNKKCHFDYRWSVFKEKENHEIIISGKFEFKNGDSASIKEETQMKIDYRIDRHPLDLPNIPIDKVPKEVLKKFEGSIKQDPFPVLPVAKLIAVSGLVGKTIGGAQVSTKHPNFIVNLKNARSRDVYDLINLVKKELKNKFQVDLEEEVLILPASIA